MNADSVGPKTSKLAPFSSQASPAASALTCAFEIIGQLPTPIFRARFLPVHARVSRIVWKGFAPLSLAVSTVVRTSASAFAAHMAR